MYITINIKADNIPADVFTNLITTDNLFTILGIEDLSLDSQSFNSDVGNEKSVNLEFIQKSP